MAPRLARLQRAYDTQGVAAPSGFTHPFPHTLGTSITKLFPLQLEHYRNAESDLRTRLQNCLPTGVPGVPALARAPYPVLCFRHSLFATRRSLRARGTTGAPAKAIRKGWVLRTSCRKKDRVCRIRNHKAARRIWPWSWA